jgi:hypothetical protein
MRRADEGSFANEVKIGVATPFASTGGDGQGVRSMTGFLRSIADPVALGMAVGQDPLFDVTEPRCNEA